MKETIEDSIISYFDGRLTDSESADLLHRASVSPEIRKLFREHEMLREMAHTAQASTVVSPELESALFSRIEAIASSELEPKRRKAVPIFWTRWRVAAAVAVLVLGSAIALGPEYFGDDVLRSGANTIALTNTNEPLAGSETAQGSTTDAPALISQQDIESSNEVASDFRVGTKQNFKKVIRADRDYLARQAANERRVAHSSESGNRTDRSDGTYASYESVADISSDGSVIASIDPKSVSPLRIGAEKGIAPRFRAEDLDRDETNFELSLENSSGFAYPASDPGVKPFADPRISLGYFIDANNIIGARLTYGLFETLPDPSSNRSSAFTNISRNLESSRLVSPGLFFTHREYAVLGDMINLDATVGAGYITNGYTLSGELGLRFPLSSKLFMGAAFGLTRAHFNARSMREIMDNVTATDGPALIEGSDVKNTINGRIQYGLSYQF